MREKQGYETRCTLLFIAAALGTWPPSYLALLLLINLLSSAAADALDTKDSSDQPAS